MIAVCAWRSNWPTWCAASLLRPRLRALTYAAVIGLLVSCGLRISEACRLDCDDVDLDEGCTDRAGVEVR